MLSSRRSVKHSRNTRVILAISCFVLVRPFSPVLYLTLVIMLVVRWILTKRAAQPTSLMNLCWSVRFLHFRNLSWTRVFLFWYSVLAAQWSLLSEWIHLWTLLGLEVLSSTVTVSLLFSSNLCTDQQILSSLLEGFLSSATVALWLIFCPLLLFLN